jgi:cytochrome P450
VRKVIEGTTTDWQQPDDLRWDPYDASLKEDPYPIWRRMRDEAPLYRNDRYNFFALSRFADVDAAHRDPATFSSAHGTVLELITEEPIHSGMMIFMDPPDHTQLRRLVSRAFSPRRVAELETYIRTLCATLLDERVGSGGFDYVADFGARVPAEVIATILGVPRESREDVRHIIDESFHIEPDVGMVNDTSINAMAKLWNYVSEQIQERRRRPRDDMLTDIVESEVTDEEGSTRRLTPEECASFGVLLASAGTETVARLIGWCGSVLAAHPEQRAELAVDRLLIPAAIEEVLQGRYVTTGAEFYGHSIPAGSTIILLTASADRDDREFLDADRFDIHRKINHHVAFGYGIHFCLGAALARMEGRIALEETLARFPTWEVDRDRAVLLHTSTVRGFAQLPILV